MKSKRISIYVSNDLLKPANYYRIVQYAYKIPNTYIHNIYPTWLFKLTIKYREYKFIHKILDKILGYISDIRIRKYIKKDLKDIPKYVIVQKSMSKYSLSRKTMKLQEELVSKSKLIWDFDDYILKDGQISDFEYNLYCRKSKYIVVTNEYLKNTLPKEYRSKVKLLCTSDLCMHIDNNTLKTINKERLNKSKETIELLWLATSANITYLEDIIPILEYTAMYLKVKYNKQLILKSICDKKINIKCHYLIINNIKWTRQVAIDEIKKSYIGIMPLRDTLFTNGKGGFKLVQYISTGLPVIASSVGYNKELFKKDIGYLLDDKNNKMCWKDAIVELATNNKKWITCSNNAIDVWEKYFNADDNYIFWKNLLK